ncbi:acyl carrier protein [Prosthecobacter sp.]|uniref:acyl carrier protein n=1 Tax=Prosthecobacter sp. TaxID=1965333 RepID=UPI0037831331
MTCRLLLFIFCVFATACGKKPSAQVSAGPQSLDQVTQIVAEQLGKKRSDVRPDVTFAALGADDLDFVEIVMATEEALGVSIADEGINKSAGVSDPQQAVKHLTILKFAALADSSPRQKPQESNEPQDGGLRATQVGSYAELSKLPNPRGHELVFVPSLEALISMSEQRAGRKLTETEVADLKARAAVIVMPPEDAAKLRKQRSQPEITK